MLLVLQAPYCAQNSASILWKGLAITASVVSSRFKWFTINGHNHKPTCFISCTIAIPVHSNQILTAHSYRAVLTQSTTIKVKHRSCVIIFIMAYHISLVCALDLTFNTLFCLKKAYSELPLFRASELRSPR